MGRIRSVNVTWSLVFQTGVPLGGTSSFDMHFWRIIKSPFKWNEPERGQQRAKHKEQ